MGDINGDWYRFQNDTVPVYVSKKGPAWFVPDAGGDTILQSLSSGTDTNLNITEQRFLQRLPDNNFQPYAGRTIHDSNPVLKELWFHVTDNCNMACRHCLFSSGGNTNASLDADFVIASASTASAMGCTVFALTGGEPFVHKDICTIITGLLSLPDAHVVVLTNALNITSFIMDIKAWGSDRFHLQISIDGLREAHELIRGSGSYAILDRNLSGLKAHNIPFTLSMAVSKRNVNDMSSVVEYAALQKASGVHFMWHFIRGRGNSEDYLTPDEIYPHLIKAALKADETGIAIDNIKALRTQIFSPAGTIHDGSGAGRESAAIGPDKKLYPSAATVGIDALATEIHGSLESVWKNSPVLKQIRSVSIAAIDHPWRFFTGGGDFDHSYMHKSVCMGQDPYVPLYAAMFLWIIEREARQRPVVQSPSLKLACGEILEQCETNNGIISTHSNCLLSVSGDSHLSVKTFYSNAAKEVNKDIVNPICYPESDISHIPQQYRFRGYGCGSPVIDADIAFGETVVDLGSGRGIECFIAARKTGAAGSVTGIDMLDPMLDIANAGAREVSAVLGYNNLRFIKGYLESLPLESSSTDVVLSNCVLNLSVHKRKTFQELYRVLRNGGRIVISDVVCEDEPRNGIRSNTTLKGECIAGALRQRDLCGLIEESGFTGFSVIKRFPYRIVAGHRFFSLTFIARKPVVLPQVKCMYLGPCSLAVAPNQTVLVPGVTVSLPQNIAEYMGNQIFIFDNSGAVTNMEMASSCACAAPQVKAGDSLPKKSGHAVQHHSGCMVCGEQLVYIHAAESHTCFYCQQSFSANAVCGNGHYVCDRCHSQDTLEVIKHVCMESKETDMNTLFSLIRSHPSVPLHGPEHHAMVPAVILTAFINSGGLLPRQIILTAIERGMQIAGGSCAFSGVCGAAAGVGIAFSLILDANPYKGKQRMQVQSAVTQVMQHLSKINAARCCRRDCFLALQCAAEISEEYLAVKLFARNKEQCRQQGDNKECPGSECPFFET